jgi:23S rRNA pseudouridine1911/1915/1917 synthase
MKNMEKTAQTKPMVEPEIDTNNIIIFENEDLILVNKSGNCPVHEGGAYKENCLTRILELKYGHRVFPVYRLDRETSGLIVFSKKNEMVHHIKNTLSDKKYYAICENAFKPEEYGVEKTIDEPIGETKGDHINWKKCVDKENGNCATTVILPIKDVILKGSNEIGSLIEVMPKTGRQHQIRVHLSYIGHSIVGDKWYGKSDKLFKDHLDGIKDENALINRQALHLGKIKIKEIQYEAEFPEDIKKIYT